MFAPLNGAPLNGGASGLWLRGTLSAESSSTATPTVARYVSATPESVADTSATPLRITHATGAPEAEAGLTVDATRLAKGWGTAAASAHINGDGYELVFMAGRSATAASISLTAPWALRPVDGSAGADAETTGSGVRHVYITPRTAEPVAESSGVSERVTPAPGAPPAEAVAEATLSAERTAWMEPSTASAVSGIECAAYRARPVTAESVADANTSIDYESWWRASLRALRTASLSWIAESRIERLSVRQRYAEARTVIRTRSSALANTKIGRGTMRPESFSGHVAGTLRLYRDHRGATYSSATGESVASRITVIKSGAIATAETHASPAVTRDGTTYRYADGPAVAVSDHRSVGHRITEATGQPTAFSESSGEPYQIHAFEGTTEAEADAWSIDHARVNPWVRATGQSVAESDQSAYTIRQDFVTAKELANSAKSTGWCYREVPTWDSTSATATVVSNAKRLAKAEGDDYAISAINIGAVIYSWRYPVIEPLIITSGGRDIANKIVRYIDEAAEPGSEIRFDATRLAIPEIVPQISESVSQGDEPHVDRYLEAESTATAQTSGVIQPHRYITAPSIRAHSTSSATATRFARFVDDPTQAFSSSVGDYERHAYLTPRPTISWSASNGTPRLTRFLRASSSSWATSNAWFARYRPMSGQARASARVPVTIYVWRFREMSFQGSAASTGDMVRITTAPQAVDGESWAETGRVSFKINPGVPAPDRRTITLMAGARSMSVPNTSREYIV
ncbi:hypothetical protein RSO41_13345 [Halomonas sp. I1]|uniref:hypothetical protein n=1 Tax=Halomonas sp. I1 TaxID=393536 RepID=UPI0028DDABE4|nr:hypothetical protein [Halomonas sp. I1]MDT8895637.1 hypothetical protein [Halomonas sp. I1]